jgi:ParB family chromosome partitioning protein
MMSEGATATAPHVQYVNVTQLRESPTNPRSIFDVDYLRELSDSIEEQGILQPLLVRQIVHEHEEDIFEIVDGACRFRAACALNMDTLPALVCVMTDGAVLEAQLVANLQRKDVHPLEEAEGFGRLIAQAGYSQAQVADRLGKKERYVRERMVLLHLTDKLRDAFRKNKITLAHAFLLARLPVEQQAEVLKWATEHRDEVIPARRVQEHIQDTYMLTLKRAAWNLEDAQLVPEAGACSTCPKRTGNDKLLFADVKAEDTCTDAACFHRKEEAFVALAFVGHEERSRLSSVPSYEQKAKGLRDWMIVTGKPCEFAEEAEGVVIQQTLQEHSSDERRKLKLGQVVRYCADKKCKQHLGHFQSDSSSTPGRSPAVRKKDRERKEELERRGRALRVLAVPQKIAPVSDAELDVILDYAIHSLGNDQARSLCKAMAWEGKKGGVYSGVSWRDTVRAHVKPRGDDERMHWLLVVACTARDAWYMPGDGKRKTELLDSALRSRKLVVPNVPKELVKKAAAKKGVRRVVKSEAKAGVKGKAAAAAGA